MTSSDLASLNRDRAELRAAIAKVAVYNYTSIEGRVERTDSIGPISRFESYDIRQPLIFKALNNLLIETELTINALIEADHKSGVEI